MKTYVVEATVTYDVELRVSAKSKEEARWVAQDAIFDGDGEASAVVGFEIDDVRREKRR